MPSCPKRAIDERTWLIAVGGDEFDPVGDVRQVVAAGQYGNWVVVVILQTTEDELTALIAEVLDPALGSVQLD